MTEHRRLCLEGIAHYFNEHIKTLPPSEVASTMHLAMAKNRLDYLQREHTGDTMNEQQLRDLLYEAWGVIANASGGNWEEQSQEWQDAAKRWRDSWHETLPKGEGPITARSNDGSGPDSEPKTEVDTDA